MKGIQDTKTPFRIPIPLAAIVLAFMITGGYALYNQCNRYPFTIKSIQYDHEDRFKLGALHQLRVTLHNGGTRALYPAFWIRHENIAQHAAYWEILNGPLPLPANTQATYRIGTEIPEKMIPGLSPIALEVTDNKHYTIKAFQRNIILPIIPAPIANPDFKYWSGVFERLPFRWHSIKELERFDKARIYQETIQGKQSVTLEVVQDGDFREKEWAQIFLSQLLRFPAFDIHVWVYPTMSEAAGDELLYLYGIEVQGGPYVMRYLFSETEGALQPISATSATIIRQAPVQQWTVHRLNLHEDFIAFGWEPPEYVFFRYFFGIHSSLPGCFKAHFGGMQY